MSVRALSEFRASEYAIAVALACTVLVGAGVALAASTTEPALVPEIGHVTAVPVRVVPVLDLDAPLLKLGGKRDNLRLPDKWARKAPTPKVEQKAFVSSKAGKTEHDVPTAPVAPAGVKPPAPSAEVVKQTDAPPPTVVPDAGPPPSLAQEGHQDGARGGTEMDPLKGRAIDVYRSRIIAWFSSRFRVHGSGLPQQELTKVRVHASVTLSPDRHVTGYTVTPSGNAAFDAAAHATLEATKGGQIPDPPDNYPDIVQTQINLTFVCGENRCD